MRLLLLLPLLQPAPACLWRSHTPVAEGDVCARVEGARLLQCTLHDDRWDIVTAPGALVGVTSDDAETRATFTEITLDGARALATLRCPPQHAVTAVDVGPRGEPVLLCSPAPDPDDANPDELSPTLTVVTRGGARKVERTCPDGLCNVLALASFRGRFDVVADAYNSIYLLGARQRSGVSATRGEDPCPFESVLVTEREVLAVNHHGVVVGTAGTVDGEEGEEEEEEGEEEAAAAPSSAARCRTTRTAASDGLVDVRAEDHVRVGLRGRVAGGPTIMPRDADVCVDEEGVVVVSFAGREARVAVPRRNGWGPSSAQLTCGADFRCLLIVEDRLLRLQL